MGKHKPPGTEWVKPCRRPACRALIRQPNETALASRAYCSRACRLADVGAERKRRGGRRIEAGELVASPANNIRHRRIRDRQLELIRLELLRLQTADRRKDKATA